MLPTFTYPWALLLFLFVPPAAWAFANRSRGAWRFSDCRLLLPATGLRVHGAWWGGLLLRILVLSLVIIALSGPRWVDERERLSTDGIAIAMVLDVSVSMGEEDFVLKDRTVSRLLGVQEVFRLFVEGGATANGAKLPGRRNDLIGLVTFATHPETACPLTLEHGPLLKIMAEQKPRTAASEGTTNPGDALAWALHVLEKAPTRRKVIVFLTDGEVNEPHKLMPFQAGQLAANLAIPIYAIDAAPQPKDDKEKSEIDRARDVMERLAKMTDGAYLRAQDGAGLVKAYESIDRLERERILSFQYRRYHEGFHWFALAALLGAMTLITLEATLWRRVP
jgi:Ca-activated chloride channel family protein